MKILRNIRSKIWACVSVALLSYLLATLSTTWVNNKTKTSITHVQEIDLPLTSKGILVHSLFNAQGEDYENGLLTGEVGEIVQANERHGDITALLDELAALAGDSHHDLYPAILSLRDDYNEYYKLASLYYMKAVQEEDIFASRTQIHQLGILRAGLDNDFQLATDMLQSMIVADLGANKQRLDLYTNLFQILFVLFLIITTLVINWLANREIIIPLQNIQKMIGDFSRGRTVDRPQAGNGEDEIQELAISFWHMTRELQHITATRDYVDNLINHMSDSLIILNPDLSIQRVNHATLSLLDAAEEELVGRSFREVFSHDEKGSSNTLFQGLLEGKPVNNIEAQYVNGEEQAITVLFSASPLYLPDGSLQGITCLAREISELKEQREHLQFLANFDRLTGLPNRNLFFDRLSWTLNDARRHDYFFAVLYLDLDRFKMLNDTYGHAAGDLALQEVARRLHLAVRDTDTVSRMGGDEFTILLSRLQNTEEAKQVAAKVLEVIGEPFPVQGGNCTLGVSIGICHSSPEIDSADRIVKNADTAMYAAKAQGRNRIMVCSSGQAR